MSDTERSNPHELERELTRFFRRSRVASTSIAAEVHPDLDVASYTVLVTISDLSDVVAERGARHRRRRHARACTSRR